MLTVAKITQGAAARYAEYLDGRSKPAALGDYYLRDGDRVEAPGRWAAGAGTFGLEDGSHVSREQLRTLLEVRRPDTGERSRPVGGNGRAVAAIDATFSAPKSVSTVWAIADEDLRAAIETAQEAAVDAALGYAVGRVAMIRERRADRSVLHARARGVVATSWRHTTARAVAGRRPDPQLHSHVLLHGAVRSDGQVMAIDSRAWLVHRRELGAAYRSQLCAELNRLGFEVRRGTGRDHRYFEIAGVPDELIERWSGRDHQIREAIEQRLADHERRLTERVAAGGQAGQDAARQLERLRQTRQLAPGENRRVTVATRADKTPTTHTDLDREWQSTALEYGLDRAAAAGLRQVREPLTPVDPGRLLERLTAADAQVTPHTGRAVALEASAGIPTSDAVDQLRQLQQTGELLKLADGRYTTRAHRGLERRTVRLAAELIADPTVPVARPRVRMAAGRLTDRLAAAGGELSQEQHAAIDAACSTDRLVVIEGHAGTGKSTVLQAVGLAHQADGRDVTVVSTAALAADRLAAELRAAGVVGAAGCSTAAFLAGVRSGQIDPAHTTIVHDEAALASTHDHHDLLAVAQQTGARLVLVGDPAQSQPVAAGGLWPRITQAANRADSVVRLTRNVRARDQADRDHQARFRDGDVTGAVAGYHEHDRVQITEEQRTAEDRALEAAACDELEGKQTLVVTQTSNRQLDALNARAQAIRLQTGPLGSDSVAVAGRPYRLHAGDPVQVRRTLRPGLGRPRLRNGTRGTVADVDAHLGTVTLAIPGVGPVVLDELQLTDADLRLAYVQHPFPAQGQTTDTTHMIASELSTREGSYVALTRAREKTMIYASCEALDSDDHEHPDRAPERLSQLAQLIGQPEPKAASIDTPLAHEHDLATASADRAVDAHQPRRVVDSRAVDPGPQRSVDPRDRPADRAPATADERRQLLGRAAEHVRDYRAKYRVEETDRRLLGPDPPRGAFTHRHEPNQTAGQVAQLTDQLVNRDAETRRSTDQARRAEQDPSPQWSSSDSPDRSIDSGFEP